jgi:hypothetical protein
MGWFNLKESPKLYKKHSIFDMKEMQYERDK